MTLMLCTFPQGDFERTGQSNLRFTDRLQLNPRIQGLELVETLFF
jgi:hypothetical protein